MRPTRSRHSTWHSRVRYRGIKSTPAQELLDMLTRSLCLTVSACSALAMLTATIAEAQAPALPAGTSQRLQFQNPDLVVDLGVGLWALPLPMDYDGDGDHDMVVATVTKPSNGIFFFENTEGNVPFPVFAAPTRLGDAIDHLTISHINDTSYVLSPSAVYPDFRKTLLQGRVDLGVTGPDPGGKLRARQWKMVDYNADGLLDVVVGLGIWAEYGWDDAYNDQGVWTNGPLHGHVFVCINNGAADQPAYGEPVQVMTTDGPVDTFGAPSPNFADFDGDGDLDLLGGEFVDHITYFQNTGTPAEPVYAKGRYLEHEGHEIRMDLCMLQVIAMDWDKDGDIDLVVGEEDGRVALLEHTGVVHDGMPAFLPPRHFQQHADLLKVGALNTPSSCDWDHDGDDDLIVGDTAGYLSLVENLDGGNPPRWAKSVYLRAGDEIIRIQAGENGSIQGPTEAKWGYTVPSVADWNHDGLLDIVTNSIWGKVVWFENTGSENAALLAPAQPITVEWEGPTPKPEWTWWNPQGDELVTQWRTTPVVCDWNKDQLNDLVMLDHEGYLAFFERQERDDRLVLLPGARIFLDAAGNPLRLNEKRAGGSGRRKLVPADWDGDGNTDFLINGDSVDLLRNVATDAAPKFELLGSLDARKIGGHSTCPTVVDWDRNGVPDLLYGAEDGFFYYLPNPRSAP